MPLKSLSLASLRRHPALIPLFVGGGVAGAAFFLTRLTTRCPDVSWNKRDPVEPWNKLSPTYQYKLYSPKRDYSKEAFPAERPNIEAWYSAAECSDDFVFGLVQTVVDMF